MNDLRKQYADVAAGFKKNHTKANQINRELMYEYIGDTKGLRILDLGCGDGYDAAYYAQSGGEVCGIDPCVDFIESARGDYPQVDFRTGVGEELPYEDDSFDAVYSKYVIMTSPDMSPIFDEVYRVLKSGGEFVYLVTHPLRQFMERKDLSADYFDQTIIECNILDNSVRLHEPTHTMNEYFNKSFFEKFELVDFHEAFDPAAEVVHGGRYPGFFIVKARKK